MPERLTKPVNSYGIVVVTSRFSMTSEELHLFRQFIITDKYCTTIAITAQWFCREKAGRSNFDE
jgi:hypothetical protein